MKHKTYNFFRENSPYSFRKPVISVGNPLLNLMSMQVILARNCMKNTKEKLCNTMLWRKSIWSQPNWKTDTLVLEFYFVQNLPKLSVSAQFCRRLLWLYVFNIQCHNDQSSKFYCFLEGWAIVLLSDSCGGQNENLTMLKFYARLSKKKRKNGTIKHIFPVKGHSYCQCDHNFGLYGKVLRDIKNTENVHQYITVLQSCRSNPFK